ncbi:hypothetical protein RHSIM_Rhsim03G0190800 [Rhododendron simsii]|uniref:UDP-N-acetylmuramate--L-alanine ligase n=1 Tax=Rhododendron simsii TaxID=118357 RepID=A0A834H6F4_RHOSS|nr:hypothetical protein RHSIM_Rhsim03G0190800 [Rhododendron simsii]
MIDGPKQVQFPGKMPSPPAASPSTSLHFPATSRQKPSFITKRIRIPALTSKEHARRVSLCATPMDRRSQAIVDSGNREDKCWVHFVGIGGCGLSALAMLALKQGYEVSGSDIMWSSFMDGLHEAGARLYVGHSVSNMQKHNGLILPKAIVVSSAIPQDNVEILYAKSVGVIVYKRDYWLAKLTEHYNLIAISGTHVQLCKYSGKSTTASMLAYVLKAMGDDITAVVGAHVPQFAGGNIICGSGRNFVLEISVIYPETRQQKLNVYSAAFRLMMFEDIMFVNADEYDGCFLELLPYIAVVTNVEWEHVDIFENEEAVISIFKRFLTQIRAGGHLVLCGDSVGACSLLDYNKRIAGPDNSIHVKSSLEPCNDRYRVTTYGISSINEWHASALRSNSQGGSDYQLCHWGCPVADISLQMPGVHNVLNSLAVVATVTTLFSNQRHITESVDFVRLHLSNFKGVSRRFEMIGKVHGCHIFDDYAHHPSEVRAVLQAARQGFQYKELLVVFQPHTYSRLATLHKEFANAFSDADLVVVTEIYGAREMNRWNISGRDLANSIIDPSSEYIPSLVDVVEKLSLYISKDPDRETLILTLGAGDITTVGRELLQKLQQRLQKSDS